MQTMRAVASRAALLSMMLALPNQARAGLILSQAVVDIQPTSRTAQDIEVWNDSADVAYVVAQPSEIIAPGQSSEKRQSFDDPAVGGLLVSPQRLILQPQERKLVRIAAVGARGSTDRIWRVTIKPVAGPVTAPVTALKLLVGYDVLVILRPQTLTPIVEGTRQGATLTLRNSGNTNVELYEGKLCEATDAKTCKALPSKRLYPGASWEQSLPSAGAVHYHIAAGSTTNEQQF